MLIKKIILTLIVAVVLAVIVIAGGSWYFFVYKKQASNAISYSTTNTPYAVLMQGNTAFVQAEAAMVAGNYDQAEVFYKQALAQAADSIQRGQIEFKLAALEERRGNLIQAIDMYKAIVANPDYINYPILKAYAVQAMEEVHYANGDPAITAEIFKDAPYSGMEVQGNSGLTYRHLEEYAVSFYPLAMPEIRIANWYAAHANATSDDGSATSTYPAIIQNAVTAANRDIDRIKSDTNAAGDVPGILTQKAALYFNMYQHGLASEAQAEQVCRDALNIFASAGLSNEDGYARYYYAVFLSQLGPSRVTDLRNVLAPFYTTSAYKNSSAFGFFSSEKANYLGQKKWLVLLAKDDPQFKDLLISLGWSTNDFQ